MFDYLAELMLRAYFGAEVTVGRFMTDRKALFDTMARIFLLPRADADALFAETQSEEVADITTESRYYQYRRMKTYFEVSGRTPCLSLESDALVDLKGAAIAMAKTHQMLRDAQDARLVICDNFTRAASSGSVPAMYLLGILESEGFVFEKNPAHGLSLIRMAADWNSEEGLLAALYYDEENRAGYLGRLYEKLRGTGHTAACEKAEAAYGAHSGEGLQEFRLLEKAMAQGIVKRDVYVKSYARMLYSKILGAKDKENLLLTTNQELLAEAGTLPLNLSPAVDVCDVEALNAMRTGRSEERAKVGVGLINRDLRRLPAYRPLCLVSDSRYLLESYARAIAACLSHAHTERIEVADLAEYHLEPSKSNIFIRSCDEDGFNAYFLFFRGEIAACAWDTAKNFLQSDKRGKFHLNRPNVTLDLRSILPVCFSDRENAKQLAPYCDIVRISDPTKTEKKELVRDMLREKSDIYRVGQVTVRDSICDRLAEYPVDVMESMIDRAIREHRGETVQLAEVLMQPYFSEMRSESATYGFGGSIHEKDDQ